MLSFPCSIREAIISGLLPGRSILPVIFPSWAGGGEQQVQADTWTAVQEIEDAVVHFGLYWQERDLWLERFHQGKLDL